MSEQGLKIRYLIPVLLTLWVTGMIIMWLVIYGMVELATWLTTGW